MLSLMIISLCFSTCWNPWLIPNNGWKWWIAYRDAMSFRASHYFVSFMSEASVIAAGFGAHSLGSHVLWHYTVTQPHNVEVDITDDDDVVVDNVVDDIDVDDIM